MLWGEKAESARSWTQDASGLSHQWSATGPWQLDDHQLSHIEDYEGCWSSGCRGLVAEHWWLKPDMSWVQFLVAASLFTFHYFRLIKFIYWLSVYLFKKNKSRWPVTFRDVDWKFCCHGDIQHICGYSLSLCLHLQCISAAFVVTSTIRWVQTKIYHLFSQLATLCFAVHV